LKIGIANHVPTGAIVEAGHPKEVGEDPTIDQIASLQRLDHAVAGVFVRGIES
jgi:hypothetical protein